MQPLQGHPYVVFEAGPNAWGQYHIHCYCRACGEDWQRPCDFPQRTMEWVNRFAHQHWHGAHRPVRSTGFFR